MAVQTPITASTFNSVFGDLRGHVAKFSSVADADTYAAPLGTIICGLDGGGSTATPYGSLSWSGSTVTFHVTSGPVLNMSILLLGY